MKELRRIGSATFASRSGFHKAAFPMGGTLYHFYVYYDAVIRAFFHNMGPGSYTGLLVFVWLFGFALLKSGARK